MLIIRLRLLQAPLLALVFCGALQAQTDNNGAVNARDGAVEIERQQRGIQAELVDAGDYYFRPDGTKARFYRKKDVFVVNTEPDRRARAMQRMKARFGDRVQGVRGHRLGNRMVVKLDNQAAINLKTGSSIEISTSMLKSLDSSISEMQPVLANARGQGDILVLPSFILKLNAPTISASQLDSLLAHYGLQTGQRLRVPGQVYTATLKVDNIDSSTYFSVARRLANDAAVAWAQPQFYAQPRKAGLPTPSFIPDDPLFAQQWHLRNTGLQQSRCDTDCDANNAWDIDDANGVGAVTGQGMVIAVIDDGVDLAHEDLVIWQNDGEAGVLSNNGIDDDANGFIDDFQGWDFVVDDFPNAINANADFAMCQNLILNDPQNPSLQDDQGQPCYCAGDGDVDDAVRGGGQDNSPAPSPNLDCVTLNGEAIAQDNHGTAVAGLAAASGNNGTGVAGVAFNAEILPIRLISEFDGTSALGIGSGSNPPALSFCARAMEAFVYAGRYADVINNSWSIVEDTCIGLPAVIGDVLAGTLMEGDVGSEVNISQRPDKGSPVVFSTGNDASGWIKVTAQVSAGEHAYEWRYLRDAFPEDSTNNDSSAWIDQITFPDGSVEGFESGINGFENRWLFNSINCDDECLPEDEIDVTLMPTWEIETDPNRIRFGNASARLDASDDEQHFCGYSYLHMLRDGPGNTVSFWIWASADLDKVEFLVDGREVFSFGDVPARAIVNNFVGFPANLSDDATFESSQDVIAVGASNSGDLTNISTVDLATEERAPYSQFGPTLDLVAPSGNQHLPITTTDRSGADGFNNGSGGVGDSNYTAAFLGTSAAAPIVSGVATAMIASNSDLTAGQVKTMLRDSADEIGRLPYTDGRNDAHGHGRVNMYKALRLARGESVSPDPAAVCTPAGNAYVFTEDLILPNFQPVASQSCPAEGPLPELDDLCLPIRTSNDRIAVICI